MLIVTHVYGTGPPQDLEEYLKSRVDSLVFIGHPFPYTADRRSFWRRWENGNEVAAGRAINWQGPEILFYLKDAWLTLYWAWRHGGPHDLVVGAGGFNAVLGLCLKIGGRAKKIIFYCIDWTPVRFNNFLLNRLYRLLDRLAVTYSDQTWNLSERMAQVRVERGIALTTKQITVPVGIWLKRYSRSPASSVNLNIMYMGHVRTGQGLTLVASAWPELVRHQPLAKLHIIGDGHLRAPLQTKLAQSGGQDSVTWHGFISDHRQVETMLAGGAIAVAMYEPGTFTQYTDPGKIKVYLAAGLPIVMTRVGAIADIIEQAGAGLVIPYQRTAFIEASSLLLTNKNRRETMRAAALKLAERYDWEVIFPAALGQVM